MWTHGRRFATSLQAMRTNPGPMLAWGAIVAAGGWCWDRSPPSSAWPSCSRFWGTPTWHLYRAVVVLTAQSHDIGIARKARPSAIRATASREVVAGVGQGRGSASQAGSTRIGSMRRASHREVGRKRGSSRTGAGRPSGRGGPYPVMAPGLRSGAPGRPTDGPGRAARPLPPRPAPSRHQPAGRPRRQGWHDDVGDHDPRGREHRPAAAKASRVTRWSGAVKPN